MNPVNLEGSVLECTKCRQRKHAHLADLDVGQVRADLNEMSVGEMPWQALKIFEDQYDA
jgi:hypothetical protein